MFVLTGVLNTYAATSRRFNESPGHRALLAVSRPDAAADGAMPPYAPRIEDSGAKAGGGLGDGQQLAASLPGAEGAAP